MGDDFCKDKAVSILKHRYRGLAVLRVEDATALGLEVADDRGDFYGHAIIDYGSPPPPPNDPLYADERQVPIALYLNVANASKYVEDSQPTRKGWHDRPL